MKKIVICGYHGFSNSGDEALLWAMIDIIRKKESDVHITVLSMHPESTSKLYGVDSVYRYNILKINKLFKSADLFLFGGGSLIQDITSSRSLYYYLAIIKLALANKVKVMLYGNGIGPLVRPNNRKKVRKCLNKVDLITLRDDLSDRLLAEIGVNKPKITITADPAFTLKFDSLLSPCDLLSHAGISENEKYAVIAIRDFKTTAHDFNNTVAAFCDELYDKYAIKSLFVPMQYEADAEIAKDVISRMKNNGYIIDRALEVDEVFSVIAFSELALGMRLHTLIYATTLGIPVIALSYDPKVTAFMQSINQPLCIDVDVVEKEMLSNALEELVTNLQERKVELNKSLEGLRKKAEENADLAVSLLGNQ